MIQQLYDVDADVQFPSARRSPDRRPVSRMRGLNAARCREYRDSARPGRPPSGADPSGPPERDIRPGAAVRGRSRAGALAVAACVLAPLVGSTHISLRARVRPLDSVCRQRRRADLLRRAVAARARRRRGRRALAAAGVVFQALLATRWRRRSRSASRPARRSARCSPSRSAPS